MALKKKVMDSVLVKPAGADCNMACTYCFYLEKSHLFPELIKRRMSEDVLEEMIKQVMRYSRRHISFSWQGGEPTLMGLSFFKKIVEIQQKYGQGHVVGNGLQTNSILIDRQWAGFLRDYCFLVGISLDGPEHIHDHYRLLRDGRGSWAIVIEKTKLLLDSSVEVNVLTVLNDYSVQFPEEIYIFLKSLGLNYMQFIPCVELDPRNPERMASFSVSPEKYGEFLVKVFDLWLSDFIDDLPTTSIRYYDSVFYHYVGMVPPECTLMKECGNYVLVEHNGDVYSCDFFVEPRWKLGNVLEGDLDFMLNSQRQKEFGKMKASLPRECRKCRWLQKCRGGCVKDRLHNSLNQKLNFLCPAYKMFFEHADRKLRTMAEDWKKRQPFLGSELLRDDESRSRLEEKAGHNDPCPCGSGKKYKSCCGKIS